MSNDYPTNPDGSPMDSSDMLDTLVVTKRAPRPVGGTWVTGTIAFHDFEALVFPEHAEQPAFELKDSRISKLFLREREGGRVVASFDRGWDQQPATESARAIVGIFCDGLAEFIFNT